MGTGRQVLARCGRCWRALELLDLSLRKHGRNCLATFVLEAVARKTECRKSAKVQRALTHWAGRRAHLTLFRVGLTDM